MALEHMCIYTDATCQKEAAVLVCVYISPSTPVTTIVVTFTAIAVTLLFLLGTLCGRECGSRALHGCTRRDHAVILSVYNLWVCEGLKDIHWRRHAANGDS